jgi:DNA-binding XRE family transcriptional regulator
MPATLTMPPLASIQAASIQSAPSQTTPLRPLPLPHARRQGERDVCFRFGRRLRELRKQHGMTQVRLARKFGVSRSFLSEVEKGKSSIGLAMAEVIALGFKITLSELMQGV